MHISQELHFNNLFALSFAGIAPSTINIKRKMLGLKTTHFAQWLFGKQLPDFIISFDVCYRIGTGRFANRILIHHLNIRDAWSIARNLIHQACLIHDSSIHFLQRSV